MAVVGLVLGAIGGAAVATTIGVSLAVGIVGGAILGAVAANTLKAIISPDIFDAGIGGPGAGGADAAIRQNAGLTLNNQGTDVNIPVVYGQRKVGGTIVYLSTSGDTNKYLYMAIVLCEGEINRVKKIYINDILSFDGYTNSGNTYGATGKFANLAQFQVFHGSDSQTASSLLSENSAWTSNHRLQGLAYLAVRLEYPKVTTQEEADANPWSGGVPKISCELEGRRIFSAFTLPDGVIDRATSYAAETSVTYTNHPVDVLLDYLRNPRYGKGLSNEKINFASFKEVRDKWDKDANGNQISFNSLHRFNGALFTDRTILDNVKSILAGMRSSLPYSQGRFRLSVEDNGATNSVYATSSTPVMTLDHTNLISEINIEGENAGNKFNSVVVTYMGGGVGGSTPTYEAVEVTYPEPGSALAAQYLSEDNNRPNVYQFALEHVTSATTANNLARLILEKSRTRGKIIGFTGDSSLAKLDVGDIVTVQYGYNTTNYPGSSFATTTPSGLVIDGKFRITNIGINEDFTFTCTAAEHDDNVYGRAPEFKTDNHGITRASSGSNVIADIYFPSVQGLPAANILETRSAIQSLGSNVFTAVIEVLFETPTDNTVNRSIVDYIQVGGQRYANYAVTDTEPDETYGNTPATRVRIENLKFSTSYQIRVYHRSVGQSSGVPAYVTVTTPAQPVSGTAYFAVDSFG